MARLPNKPHNLSNGRLSAADRMNLAAEVRIEAEPSFDLQGATDAGTNARRAMRHYQEFAPLRDMDGGEEWD